MEPSNAMFMRAVFGELPDGALPGLASFGQNPRTAKAGAWRAEPWVPCTVPAIPGEANNYLTVSSYYQQPGETFRRTSANFAALHAVVLDDVGTKAGADAVTLPPTWKLETSPGNAQWGYIISPPITGADLAGRVMRAVIAAGLCDPGAGEPTARYARMPRGWNAKHSPPFRCVMHEWEPTRRYAVDELVQGLALVLPEQQRKRPYVTPKVPHTQQAKRLAEALAMAPATEYAAWIRGLGAIKAATTLGVLSDDEGQAMFTTWSAAAGPQATAQNDDTRFDPVAMWARWSPSTAPADALLGALYAAARDAALGVVRDQITADGALDGKGLTAARYAARHHARAFKALSNELGDSQ